MATTDGGPFLPVGYDSGFDDLHFFDGTGQSLPLFPGLEDMTQIQFDDEAIFLPQHSPNETVSSRSDVRSPGKQNLQATAPGAAVAGSRGSCSLSPAADALIYTPASTLLDFQDDTATEDLESDQVTTSPDSSNHTDDFVHVGSGHGRRMNIRPPLHQQPGVSPSTQPALPSRESSVPQSSQATRPQQWHSFTSSTTSAGMDDSFIPYSSSADLGFSSGAFADDDLYSVGDLDGSFNGQIHENIPFRTFNDGSVQLPSGFNDSALLQQQHIAFRQHQHVATTYPDQRLNQTFTAFSPLAHQQYGDFNAHDFAYQGNQMNPTVANPPQPNRVLPSNAHLQQQPPRQPLTGSIQTTSTPSASARSRRQPYLQLQQAQFSVVPPVDEKPVPSSSRRSPTNASGHNFSTSTFPARPSQPYPIVKKEPSAQAGASSTGPVRSSQTERARRGGRTRNSHLTEHTRQKSHAMRKVGACWRCAMQRDPCDDGNPCLRCETRSQRGQTYFFDCDRSKLPDFVHDFLPPSMTLMHQKQSIEDTVSEEVLQWDSDNSIDVYLSSGYGPPLRWTMYEFKPRTLELLSQLQYFQDVNTGQSMSRTKYSPPFGLLKIDTSDDAHFDAYLDQLLEPQHLQDFGWSCYEEESQVDHGEFQATLLDMMCGLHMRTTDASLRSILTDILRMMMITYIMGHTLTIVEDTLPTVISHVRHTSKPNQCAKYTSPRLANRQLKFFFAVLRNNIYEKILKWQQQTLHTAGKKENTWLQAFCVMLGFAMVLEEVQRTIQIQADASARKNEMSYDDAQRQAKNACERIDERFKLLIGLFQCKYRDKKWGETGSFGNGTPELKEPVQKEFLRSLRALVVQRYDHLKGRENVAFSTQTQCLYTTRLTARFLLPFLTLPA